MNYKLQELLDIPRLRTLLDSLDEIHNMPSAILDTEGTVLTATAWQDICTKFHRINPHTEQLCRESDRQIKAGLDRQTSQIVYRCPMGLVDAAMPIIIEGHHLGNVFTGQLFTDIPIETSFMEQARKYGFKESEYLAAMRKVPFFSEDTLRKNLHFIWSLTQMLAEQGLQHKRQMEAEWKFQALFDNGPIGVAYHRMIYDDSGKPVDYYFIDANDKYLELTGVDPRGKTVIQAFPGIENDSFDWIGVFGHVARTGQAIRFEQHLQLNDRWYDCVGYQYKPDHFVVAFLEITERKRVEQESDDRKRLLDTLLANLPVAVFMVEAPGGKPLIANIMAKDLLGRGILGETSKDTLTEVYEAYKYGTDERYPTEEMPIVRGMRGETSQVDDLIIIRPDGTARLLEIFGTPVVGADGRPWASLVCFQDITERKKHEKELLKIEKLESLGLLAGGIAHDFNNILTGIMGNISFALRFIEESHKAHKALVGAEHASERATELARQLLTFARGGEPIKKILSLKGLVDESVSLVLRGSNVKGIYNIPDSIHAINADEGQICQVFHNIIINATHASPGGGTLTVAARNTTLHAINPMSLPAGPYVCLTFTDQGCGISQADLMKIFDPYFTTKVAGNGLGLASAHAIITRHGGRISATSEIGKGTTFTIYLPSMGETVHELQTESAAQTAGDHKGGSILVMDDEQMIQDLTTAMLEELGYKVTTCGDGAEALSLYATALKSEKTFSAVIMDLTIPGGMGGKEAAEKILGMDAAARLIVSSGYSNDPIMSDYGAYGFNGAIAKPYKMKDLEQMLRSLLP